MTVEEIKDNLTMQEVLAQYGIKVRGNMCSCPFHGEDRHPSMQIFNDGYKCHTCLEYGDIFKFVQRMEGCDFKEAFLRLGGSYEKHKNESSRIISKISMGRRRK